MYFAFVFDPLWGNNDHIHGCPTSKDVYDFVHEQETLNAPIGHGIIVVEAAQIDDLAPSYDGGDEQWTVGKPIAIFWRGQALYDMLPKSESNNSG